MEIDFSKLSKFEIEDLIRDANTELENYAKRSKIKVYTNFIPFTGTRHFLKKENALEDLEDFKYQFYTHDESAVKISCTYITESDAEFVCIDYQKVMEEKKYAE